MTPEVDQLLDKTANKILQASCGEGWLVQPRIANMTGLEYRVYMLGGATEVSIPLLLTVHLILPHASWTIPPVENHSGTAEGTAP